MHFLKEGQKIRAWVDPPPHSGNAQKKTFFFFNWPLPLFGTIWGFVDHLLPFWATSWIFHVNAVDWQISYFEDNSVFYHTIHMCILCCPFPVQYKFGTFKQNCVHFGTISQPNWQQCLDTARSQKSQLWLWNQGHFGKPKSWLNPKKVAKVEIYVIFAVFVFCGWGAKADF